MANKTQKIGILGGTFDPIHRGHLQIAQAALSAVQLDQIRFVLSANPPHRVPPMASVADRAAMVQLAIADQPKFIFDDSEIKRPGPSYMVDTLTGSRQAFPQACFYLLIGMDAMAGLSRWHDWETLFSLCHFIVIDRPDCERPHHAMFDHRWETDPAGLAINETGKLYHLKGAQYPQSSTEIRGAFGGDAKGGRDAGGTESGIRSQLDPKVWEMIMSKGLYQ